MWITPFTANNLWQIAWLKATGCTAVETKSNCPKLLTYRHLGDQSQSGSSLWHRKSQSHPGGIAVRGQNITPTLLAGLREKRIRGGAKEPRLIICESGSNKEQRERDTAWRARHPAPINFTCWYTLPAKRAPFSAKWRDVQMGRRNCLCKLRGIIFTFLCDGLMRKAFTCLQRPSAHAVGGTRHIADNM